MEKVNDQLTSQNLNIEVYRGKKLMGEEFKTLDEYILNEIKNMKYSDLIEIVEAILKILKEKINQPNG